MRPEHAKRGAILLDILVAFSVSVLFISGIVAQSQWAADIFRSAKERGSLLDAFEARAGFLDDLSPGRSATTSSVSASARLYGNERKQTDFTVNGPGKMKANFASVRNLSFSSPEETYGSSLCSADFASGSILGQFSPSAIDPHSPKITPIYLPIDPLLPLTDMEARGDMFLVSADSAVQADPDLFMFRLMDDGTLGLRGSLDTGPGIQAISLAGGIVYAAVPSISAQLHIISVGPMALSLVQKYKIPLPYATSSSPLGSSIYSRYGLAFLGTTKWEGDEFNVIDVRDPTPSKISGLEIGSKVEDIFAGDKTVQIASAGEYQLWSADVSDPHQIRMTDSLSFDGWERQEGAAVTKFEDAAGMGRTSGGYDIAEDHELLSFSKDLSDRLSANVPGGAYGLVLDRPNIYLISREAEKEFQIWKRDLSASSTYSLPVLPKAITCDMDKIYILARLAPVIYEISFNR